MNCVTMKNSGRGYAMNYLFKETGKKEYIKGEFACFNCYEVTDVATVEDGVLIYKCPNDHITELPWGTQGELELEDE